MTAFSKVEDIEAWQMAYKLATEVYKLCLAPPICKDFVMRDQMSRAALSMPLNIAEGFGRRTDKEFARYLAIAKGSATELKTLFYIAKDIGYLDQELFNHLHSSTSAVTARITGLIRYLKDQDNSNRAAGTD